MKRREWLGWGAAALGLALPARAEKPEDSVDVKPLPAPSDATVLFDGKNLAAWVNRRDGAAAGWTVRDGYMEVRPRNGDIITKELFEDCRLHLEFWLPLMPDAKGQARANSGVYVQGRYEVQILDSYGLDSRDNDCGGIYKVAKPLVNACKKPEFWQSYDMEFRAPRFNDAGQQTSRGRISVRHNGVPIHRNTEFDAQVTTAGLPGDLTKPGPLLLQDHSNLVRFRNVWIVRL
ncbi:MAG: DUF1080 domain-containing protein [Armatimonadetes bacterium]|nr:DUF1080 domain-containing protein [Armatimonadota bacterium]